MECQVKYCNDLARNHLEVIDDNGKQHAADFCDFHYNLWVGSQTIGYDLKDTKLQ